jgi:anti-sigma regulatory factor (Ser/Thr protein kinase)
MTCKLLSEIVPVGISDELRTQIEEFGPWAPERTLSVRMPAHTAILAKLAAILGLVLTDEGFDGPEISRLQLALDEVAANIVMHAYEGRPGCFFQVDFLSGSQAIGLVITDSGKSFDFSRAVDRYDGKAHVDQAVGGIGLFLVKKYVDRVAYHPDPQLGNRLLLVKKKPRG